MVILKEGTMTKKVTKSEVVAEDSGKKQALDLAIQQITKQFGTGAIMKLGDTRQIDVELLPSGSLSLDLALGGGYPKGRIIEIYGPESSVAISGFVAFFVILPSFIKYIISPLELLLPIFCAY